MKLPLLFIERPVYAIVLNVMLVIIGIICMQNMEIREFPKVDIGRIIVFTAYPNAGPELVESTVSNVLEDKLAGVQGLDELTSESKYGLSEVVLTLKEGISIDRALIEVRDAIQQAKSELPKEVKEPEVRRGEEAEGFPFISIAISSDSLNFGELTHYTNLYLINTFRSIPGVSKVQVWGRPYTMEVKLDHKKMFALGINPDEVIDALQRTTAKVSLGKFQENIPTALELKLSSPDEFEQVFIKNVKDKPIFLKHIAAIELKDDDKMFRVRINGKSGVVLAIDRNSDSNPLEVSRLVSQSLDNLKDTIPDAIKISKVIDQSLTISKSIANIKATVIEAILLVLIVVFLFLRNIRTALIPLVTIPLSLIGGFIFLKVFGFSINTLTLLGMVLAIGLVVDDAIVMLENISRHIEKGDTPLNAAKKGAQEIGFAIVAMTLTLASVYIPIVFVKGVLGKLFIEFAVILAGCVIISGITALTLSPLMCGYLISSQDKHFLPQVDVFLNNLTRTYESLLKKLLNNVRFTFGLILFVLLVSAVLFYFLPREMAPREDRSMIGAYIPPISGLSTDDRDGILMRVEKIMGDIPEAQQVFAFMGNWGGTVVLLLSDPSERSRTAEAIIESKRPLLKVFPSIDVYGWNQDSGLPGIQSNEENNELTSVVQTTNSYKQLYDTLVSLKKKLEKQETFAGVNTNLNLDSVGYVVALNNNTLATSGIEPAQVGKAIEVAFSGVQNLEYELENRRYPITIKWDTKPWSLEELYLTNPKGQRFSLATLADMEIQAIPEKLQHYNQMRSAKFKATAHPGQTIPDMMSGMKRFMDDNLPQGYNYIWGGSAKLYSETSNTLVFLFIMALVFIYAILALQFNNFIDPLIIMITVPLACGGALLVMMICGQSLNIYTQIGIITLIGLITKHGILIVEFAAQQIHAQVPLKKAIIKAAKLRLRPILMTTAAMIFGAIPLIFASGTGSEARIAIGLVLFGGLFFGTILTLFVLPTLLWLMRQRFDY